MNDMKINVASGRHISRKIGQLSIKYESAVALRKKTTHEHLGALAESGEGVDRCNLLDVLELGKPWQPDTEAVIISQSGTELLKRQTLEKFSDARSRAVV